MNIINLSEQNSLVSQFLLEMRDVDIQKDRMRFRRNVERLGEIISYEISKTLQYKETEVIF
jgi:uracil phosphoribosyltransferase